MWILERGEAQWLAWREWWLGPFEHKFWPETSKRVAMVSEWPPETVQASAAVADYWRGIRETIRKDETKAEAKRTACPSWERPIPMMPRPWLRWPPAHCEMRVQAFRNAENPPDAIKPAPRTDNVLHMPKRQPSYTPGVD